MTNSSLQLNNWLALLSSNTYDEISAADSFPGGCVLPVSLWRGIYNRFPSNDWHATVATWIIHDYLSDLPDNPLLEHTLQRVYDYKDALYVALKHLNYVKSRVHVPQSCLTDLEIVSALFTDGMITHSRDVYFRPVLADLLPAIDVIGDVLDLLKDDEWGDLPYPVPVIDRIIHLAQTDLRTRPNTDGENSLLSCIFITGINTQLTIGDLPANDYISESQHDGNVYKTVYALSAFYNKKLNAQPDYTITHALALSLQRSLTVRDRALIMKMMLVNSDVEVCISNWLACLGPTMENLNRVNRSVLWRKIQPTWHDFFDITEGLGLEGNDQLEACLKLSEQQLKYAVSLPNDLQH